MLAYNLIKTSLLDDFFFVDNSKENPVNNSIDLSQIPDRKNNTQTTFQSNEPIMAYNDQNSYNPIKISNRICF
jgi:hypothetical protein